MYIPKTSILKRFRNLRNYAPHDRLLPFILLITSSIFYLNPLLYYDIVSLQIMEVIAVMRSLRNTIARATPLSFSRTIIYQCNFIIKVSIVERKCRLLLLTKPRSESWFYVQIVYFQEKALNLTPGKFSKGHFQIHPKVHTAHHALC